jgi:hypothetical protein
MSTYKCKFCGTAAKSMAALKRHASDAHRREFSEVKEYLDAVDAKFQSILGASAVDEDGLKCTASETPIDKKPSPLFLESHR